MTNLVILESPYSSPTREGLAANLAYARRALLDSLAQGESPFASHLLYPQVLDDEVLSQRRIGMIAGQCWLLVASKMVVYTDLGISPGMAESIALAREIKLPIFYRSLGAGVAQGEALNTKENQS